MEAVENKQGVSDHFEGKENGNLLCMYGLNLKRPLLSREFECLVSTLWYYLEGCAALRGRAQLLKQVTRAL